MVYRVTQCRDVPGEKCEPRLFQCAACESLGFEDLNRHLLTLLVEKLEASRIGVGELNRDLGDIRAWPAECVHDNDRDSGAAGIDSRGDGFPGRLHELLAEAPAKLVTLQRVVIDMIGHDAGGQVVCFVEENPFPRPP